MFWAIDLVVISALSTVVTAVSSLNVNVKPVKDKYIQPLGSSIVFTCEVTGRTESQVRIQWLDNSRSEIMEDPSKRVYVEGTDRLMKKLYVTNMENRDSGWYHCVATAGSVRQNKSVELKIFKDITFDHVPNPQHPAIHTDAIIECHVSGEPEPQVSWKYNKRPFDFGNRYIKVRTGLRIRNITLADDGNYTCCAEVEAEGRYDDRTITVAVHIPPSRVEFTGKFEEVEGNNVSLNCTARGLPSPKFEFYKDNRGKLSSSTDRIVIDADGGKLLFRPVRKEDEGLYTCTAINDVGTNSTAHRLTVLVPPRIYDLKNVTKSEREVGTLVCRSHGDPKPTIEFHKEGNLQPYHMGSNDDGGIQIIKRGDGHVELIIRSLTPYDAGNYTCASRNSAGYDNRTCVIDVHYKPHFDNDHKSLVYGWAGTKHNITCHVHAQPMPTIRWIRYNRILENNETFAIHNSGKHSILQVRIKEADQSWIYGDYICRAENSKGRADQMIHLNRATVPDAPIRVTNKDISPNQVVLQVDPPRENGGVQVIGYRVEFESIVQDVSIGNLPVETEDPRRNRFWYNNYTAAELSIDNLRPGTKYVFRIRAKNDVGVGNEFEHIVTTANLTNPYPLRLTCSSRGTKSDSYRVTWERPKTGGRPIKGYEFRYRKVRTGSEDSRQRSREDEEWKTENVYDNQNAPLLEYTLRGLTPMTDYQLQVLATNDLGTSAPNEEFFFNTLPVAVHRGNMCCSGVVFYRLFGSSFHPIGCLMLVISTFATKWIAEGTAAKI